MGTEDRCTPDDGQFVVAAFELSLAYLFADNCGEASTFGSGGGRIRAGGPRIAQMVLASEPHVVSPAVESFCQTVCAKATSRWTGMISVSDWFEISAKSSWRTDPRR